MMLYNDWGALAYHAVLSKLGEQEPSEKGGTYWQSTAHTVSNSLSSYLSYIELEALHGFICLFDPTTLGGQLESNSMRGTLHRMGS